MLKNTQTKKRVADGINRPAILNMRQMLVQLPNKAANIDNREFYRTALAETASRKDAAPSRMILSTISDLQKCYQQLCLCITDGQGLKSLYKQLANRAAEINRADRITGDGLLYVVDEILKARKKQKVVAPIQEAIDRLIEQQTAKLDPQEDSMLDLSPKASDLVRAFISLVDGYKESI